MSEKKAFAKNLLILEKKAHWADGRYKSFTYYKNDLQNQWKIQINVSIVRYVSETIRNKYFFVSDKHLIQK